MLSHRVQADVWWLLHGSSKPECPKVLRTHGGECRPSAMSDSEHWASPCMTARPRRKRSAYDWALKSQRQDSGDIQRSSFTGLLPRCSWVSGCDSRSFSIPEHFSIITTFHSDRVCQAVKLKKHLNPFNLCALFRVLPYLVWGIERCFFVRTIHLMELFWFWFHLTILVC